MPYHVSWYLRERIICAELQGILTLQEIIEGNAILRQFIKSNANTVHILVDVQQLKLFPTNIQQIYDNYPRRHTNTGYVVLIGGTPVMQFTANVLVKLFGARMRFAANMDEAIAILGRHDTSLVAQSVKTDKLS